MTTEQEKTVGALKQAIQIEIDGKEFYLKASKASNNQLGKQLLKTLAGEEDQHRLKFEEIFKAISSRKAWPETDFKPDGGRGLRTVFASALEAMERQVNTLKTEMDAVQKAMEMENKTYDFYKSRSDTASYEAEKDFYKALSGQEQEHFRVLLDYFEFLKNPAGWFVEKEHPSLDGG